MNGRATITLVCFICRKTMTPIVSVAEGRFIASRSDGSFSNDYWKIEWVWEETRKQEVIICGSDDCRVSIMQIQKSRCEHCMHVKSGIDATEAKA